MTIRGRDSSRDVQMIDILVTPCTAEVAYPLAVVRLAITRSGTVGFFAMYTSNRQNMTMMTSPIIRGART